MKHTENKIIAILGPTNTGKTYMAIEKMLEFNSGNFWSASKTSGQRSL